MRIGVVGLLPKQVVNLEKHHFESEVNCFDSDGRFNSSAFGRFVLEHDRLLLLEKMVPTHVAKTVPLDKRVVLSGSVSSVARYIEDLEALNRGAPLVARVDSCRINRPWEGSEADDLAKAVQSLQNSTKTQAVVEPATKETTQVSESPKEPLGVQPTLKVALAELPARVKLALAKDVPSGKDSQYHLPKGDVLINYPNSGGVQDYRILKASQPGDVVRFARPEGLELGKWRNRVGATRNNYWRQYGILLEAHFYEEYVDLLVMDQTDNTLPRHTVAVRREEPDHEPRDLGSTVLVASDEGVPAVLAETPVKEAPREKPVYTEAEQTFWREICLSAYGRGLDMDQAAFQADQAVAEYRKRFS